jgi:ribosomal protein L11 methyltransferase
MQVAIVPEKPQISTYFRQPVGEKFLVTAGRLPRELLVKPLEPLEAERIPLHLNPSFAFGSGLHPATMVSLQMLERYVLPGMNTLDLGSGSGILSVAMAKLGAKVLALDNDPIAVQATQAAIDLNQVQSQVVVEAGSLGKGSNLGHWLGGSTAEEVSIIVGNFDLVMANIFARIHIALAQDYYQALHQRNGNKGILITAGFTTDQEEDVTLACQAAGFVLIDRWEQNPWVSLVYEC